MSEKTAYEMALGLLNTNHTDIAIATTGLVGPKSDRSMLPVGLCFIAVGTKERILVYRYKFDGDRENITKTAINYALFLALFIVLIFLVPSTLYYFEWRHYTQDKKDMAYSIQEEIDEKIVSVKSLLNYTFFDEDFQRNVKAISLQYFVVCLA